MDNAAIAIPFVYWAGFFTLVALLLVIDLGILQRKPHDICFKRSICISGAYMLIAGVFGIGVYTMLGAKNGLDFFTGYLVEKSLSADNIFIISLIFLQFSIPHHMQHRVLLCGIVGALLLRGIFIALGAALVTSFHPVLYVFAAFLLFTGTKMLFFGDKDRNVPPRFINWLTQHIPVSATLHGHHFFVRAISPEGKNIWQATPLFIALLCVECADVIFATDSVPAVFAITTTPFIIYTSNIFAILGLRALYFALAAIIHRFHYVSTALAGVLLFIGAKIFISGFVINIPSSVSLIVTVLLLGGGIITSLIFPKK